MRTFFDSAKFSVTSLQILFLCLSLHFFSFWNSYYWVAKSVFYFLELVFKMLFYTIIFYTVLWVNSSALCFNSVITYLTTPSSEFEKRNLYLTHFLLAQPSLEQCLLYRSRIINIFRLNEYRKHLMYLIILFLFIDI